MSSLKKHLSLPLPLPSYYQLLVELEALGLFSRHSNLTKFSHLFALARALRHLAQHKESVILMPASLRDSSQEPDQHLRDKEGMEEDKSIPVGLLVGLAIRACGEDPHNYPPHIPT
jgi:hypothetical protein